MEQENNIIYKNKVSELEIKPLHNEKKQDKHGIPYPLPNFETRSNFIMSIIAPTGSGKSVLISNLVRKYYFRVFDKIYFCSSNVSERNGIQKVYDQSYEKIEFDDLRIFPTINNEVIDYIKNDIEADDEFNENLNEFHSLLIIDDLITEVASRRNIDIIKFILKSRHLHCSVIIVSHKMNFLPTVIRNNLTDVVLYRSKSKQEIKTIYDNLIDLDKDLFEAIYNYATKEKHHFLYTKLNSNPQQYFADFTEEFILNKN